MAYELADLLGRTDVPHRCLGPVDVDIRRIRNIAEAGAGDLTFARGRHAAHAGASSASAIVTDHDEAWVAAQPNSDQVTWVLTDEPRLLVAQVATAFEMTPTAGVDGTAVVASDASVAASAHVGPHVVVGPGCSVGEDAVLHPGVVLLHDVHVGEGSVIGPGTVVGFDGFGYERNDAGTWVKLPHLGGVVIGRQVEIGANACIDRGTFGDTVIEDRARIDNLVHIAHNVRVGEDAMVIALTMVGGSTTIGSGTWIAPATALLNGIEIGSESMTGLGAVVLKDIPDGETWIGVPARPLVRR